MGLVVFVLRAAVEFGSSVTSVFEAARGAGMGMSRIVKSKQFPLYLNSTPYGERILVDYVGTGYWSGSVNWVFGCMTLIMIPAFGTRR